MCTVTVVLYISCPYLETGFSENSTQVRLIIIMRLILLICFVLLCFVSTSFGNDLIVGTSYNARLTWQKNIEYVAFPFKKRVKEVFYSDPGQQIIKGIIARENQHTEGVPIITAGGVGFSYVNIRFKSERGSGIYYNIEVYT